MLARELAAPDAAGYRFVFTMRVPWLKVEGLEGDLTSVNLDGEPVPAVQCLYCEVIPRVMPFVLPAAAAGLLTPHDNG